MLIYVLVHCDQIHIEIEVEYMWGLLDPSLLSGEGGYYLTVLSSASKGSISPFVSVWSIIVLICNSRPAGRKDVVLSVPTSGSYFHLF